MNAFLLILEAENYEILFFILKNVPLDTNKSKEIMPNSYEEALKELQEIMDKLEHQEIKIEEIAAYTERSQLLIQYCKDRLHQIERDTEQFL